MTHALSLATILVDPVAQARVVVQCARTGSEPEWRFWVTALAPWIGPLMSGVVSIYVAWKVFRWQGKKEHEQWIRDQKKAEWRELLDVVSSSQTDLVRAGIPLEQIQENAMEESLRAKEALLAVDRTFDDRLFINPAIIKPFKAQWFSLVDEIKRATDLDDHTAAASRWYLAFGEYIEAMRATARKDLGISDEDIAKLK